MQFQFKINDVDGFDMMSAKFKSLEDVMERLKTMAAYITTFSDLNITVPTELKATIYKNGEAHGHSVIKISKSGLIESATFQEIYS